MHFGGRATRACPSCTVNNPRVVQKKDWSKRELASPASSVAHPSIVKKKDPDSRRLSRSRCRRFPAYKAKLVSEGHGWEAANGGHTSEKGVRLGGRCPTIQATRETTIPLRGAKGFSPEIRFILNK